MKLKLGSGYRIFEHCRAHGETYGSRWWVTHRPWPDTDAIWIVVLPVNAGANDRRSRFLFRYPYATLNTVGIMTVLDNVRFRRDAYPEILRSALVFEIQAMADWDEFSKSQTVYSVDRQWYYSNVSMASYDARFDRHYFREHEITECCVRMTHWICEKMANIPPNESTFK